jgi:uncharacterized membrane protein (UPF0136 family)
VFVTGGAFLIGWRYTTAFYDRLGIPAGALHLQPTDYITAKVEIWYALAAAALVVLVTAAVFGGLLPVLGPLRATVLGRLVGWEFHQSQVFWLVSLTVGAMNVVWAAVGLALTDSQGLLYIFATGVALLAMGVWGIMRDSPRWAPLSGVAALVMVSAIAALSLDIVAPQLGHHDAEALLAGPEEGSGARFVAAEPLGLPGERYEAGVYVTEAVGVVRATDNAYFVVVRGTETVYSLPATRVLRVEYTPHEGR